MVNELKTVPDIKHIYNPFSHQVYDVHIRCNHFLIQAKQLHRLIRMVSLYIVHH